MTDEKKSAPNASPARPAEDTIMELEGLLIAALRHIPAGPLRATILGELGTTDLADPTPSPARAVAVARAAVAWSYHNDETNEGRQAKNALLSAVSEYEDENPSVAHDALSELTAGLSSSEADPMREAGATCCDGVWRHKDSCPSRAHLCTVDEADRLHVAMMRCRERGQLGLLIDVVNDIKATLRRETIEACRTMVFGALIRGESGTIADRFDEMAGQFTRVDRP